MIYINVIPSLRDPESSEIIFDDRKTKIPIIGGVVLQNYGHIAEGDAFALTCVFSKENYERLESLWLEDQRVSFTDESGTVHNDLTLYFIRRRYIPKFPDYVTLIFELWRAK